MARSQVKWNAEITAWLEIKKRNPNLSHEEFYRLRGLKAKTAQKRIGKRMSEAWGKVQVHAQDRLEHSMGISLAKELETTFRASKEIFGRQVARLLPDPSKRNEDGTIKPPELSPTTAGEAAKVAKVGLDGILGVTQRLTGGDRMLPKSKVEGTDPVFRWTTAKKPPKRRTRRKKKARK